VCTAVNWLLIRMTPVVVLRKQSGEQGTGCRAMLCLEEGLIWAGLKNHISYCTRNSNSRTMDVPPEHAIVVLDYRTGPTPSLNHFDFCCGQGEFSLLSDKNPLRPADRLDHIQMLSEIIVESLRIGSCGQI